jgi:hypothetical protein
MLACWHSISWLNGWWGTRQVLYSARTEVVFTPQSNLGVVGEGAGGVSTHSKVSSEVLLLIFTPCRGILQDAEQRC